MPYKVKVDRDLCIGAASCVAVAPKTFELDNEGKAVIKKKGINNFSRATKNGREGVSYETKVREKYYSGGRSQSRPIENTYILGNIFPNKGKIIEATCALSGPNYKTMIPTCEEIIKSLQFIQ